MFPAGVWDGVRVQGWGGSVVGLVALWGGGAPKLAVSEGLGVQRLEGYRELQGSGCVQAYSPGWGTGVGQGQEGDRPPAQLVAWPHGAEVLSGCPCCPTARGVWGGGPRPPWGCAGLSPGLQGHVGQRGAQEGSHHVQDGWSLTHPGPSVWEEWG